LAEEDHVLGVPFALWTKQIATRLIPNFTTRGAVSTLLGAVTMPAGTSSVARRPHRGPLASPHSIGDDLHYGGDGEDHRGDSKLRMG